MGVTLRICIVEHHIWNIARFDGFVCFKVHGLFCVVELESLTTEVVLKNEKYMPKVPKQWLVFKLVEYMPYKQQLIFILIEVAT